MTMSIDAEHGIHVRTLMAITKEYIKDVLRWITIVAANMLNKGLVYGTCVQAVHTTRVDVVEGSFSGYHMQQ